MITYDEMIDMWSYYVGEHTGVADTKQELVEKVWDLIYSWKYGEVQCHTVDSVMQTHIFMTMCILACSAKYAHSCHQKQLTAPSLKWT